jgi:hypothetical protein
MARSQMVRICLSARPRAVARLGVEASGIRMLLTNLGISAQALSLAPVCLTVLPLTIALRVK